MIRTVKLYCKLEMGLEILREWKEDVSGKKINGERGDIILEREKDN